MKSILLSLSLIFLSACAVANKAQENSPSTTLLFSPSFSLELPLTMLEGTKIIATEGIFLRFKDRSYLSGTIVMNGEGTLPEGYDIRKYPRYRFGLDSLDSLSLEEKKNFEADRNEFKYSLNNPKVITYSDSEKIYYHACSETECESYVVNKKVDDQILVLFGNGLDLEFMQSITKGIK